MKLTFLQEAQSRLLSKAYERNNSGALDASNYYQQYVHFTSFEEDIDTIQQMHLALKHHSELGNAVVKGNYTRPLVSESRAGLVDKAAPTQWLCLDFDGVDTHDYVTTLLAPLGMSEVSHIVQYSASHGVKPGFRAHIFLMLNAPISEALLKQWYMWLNLTNPALSSSMELTSTGNALKWPLDISLAESHRIIYIAPPRFTNMADPFSVGQVCGHMERTTLVERSLPTFNITQALASADLQSVGTRKAEKRDQLRSKAGLRKKQENLHHVAKHNVYVAKNPDAATVTGYKEERGFAYLNLNGGDSWGYFHPLDNFEVIQNFKGEPPYLTKDLLPDYYTECVGRKKSIAAKQSDLSDESTKKFFYFTEKASGMYMVGEWDPKEDFRLLTPVRTREQISDFCIQHGLEQPAFVPFMDTTFDPTMPVFYDPDKKLINLYKPTEFRKAVRAADAPEHAPTTIQRILRHVTGDSEETYYRFLNWLAYLWQYGEKPKTAWVLHGTTGTGKGVLMGQILAPIFGEEHAREITHEPLSDRFNGFLVGAQVLAIDESDTDGMNNASAVESKLKNWITEEHIEIREMRKNSYKLRNRTGFLIFSNKPNPQLIDWEDRRFSVAPRQEVKLLEIMDAKDFRKIPGELQDFANYLQAYDVDVYLVGQPLENEAKQAIQHTTSSSPGDIVRAIKLGDFRFFVDLLPAGITDGALSATSLAVRDSYKKVLGHIYSFIKEAPRDRQSSIQSAQVNLARDDLATLFNYALGWNHPGAKFGKIVSKYGMQLTPTRVDGRTVQGARIFWNVTDEDLEVYRDMLTPSKSAGVEPLRKQRLKEAIK